MYSRFIREVNFQLKRVVNFQLKEASFHRNYLHEAKGDKCS